MFIFLLVIAQFLAAAEGNYPGLKVRLSQPGLNYAASVAVDILSQKVLHVSIPDQSGREKVAVGNVDYVVKDMKITSFQKPNSLVLVNPLNGITWSIDDASISLDGGWKYSYGFGWGKIRDSGGFSADAAGVSVSVSVTLGREGSGRPTISSTDCTSRIDDLTIRLRGGASWLYNLFLRYVKGKIRRELEHLICEKARKAIDENGREELATLNVEADIDYQLKLDYKLVQDPVVGNEFVEFFHKGEIYSPGGERLEGPMQALPVQTSGRMLTVSVSDYLLNSGGFSLFKAGHLKHTLTKEDLPESEKYKLNTTCRALDCLVAWLPQVPMQYPNASIEIELEAQNPPIISVSSSGIRGDANVSGIFSARLTDGSLAKLFKIRLSTTATISMLVEDNKLKGKVERFRPTVSLIDSQIGLVSEVVLTGVVKFAGQQVIKKINEEAANGLPLPNVGEVSFSRSNLQVGDHSLTIMSDVVYHPKKK